MAIWKRLKKYKEVDVEEQEEEKGNQLEKKDIPALLLSAFLTLWLPALIILIVLCGLVYLFLGFPFAG